ncbi:hypothetical protein Sjap_020334 [Stephania japonica]|uniref:Uncharacterized protein n=1 Tax=Stephania japonica TaxID=461633 RepID=A0AAP0I0C9_9MAGN
MNMSYPTPFIAVPNVINLLISIGYTFLHVSIAMLLPISVRIFFFLQSRRSCNKTVWKLIVVDESNNSPPIDVEADRYGCSNNSFNLLNRCTMKHSQFYVPRPLIKNSNDVIFGLNYDTEKFAISRLGDKTWTRIERSLEFCEEHKEYFEAVESILKSAFLRPSKTSRYRNLPTARPRATSVEVVRWWPVAPQASLVVKRWSANVPLISPQSSLKAHLTPRTKDLPAILTPRTASRQPAVRSEKWFTKKNIHAKPLHESIKPDLLQWMCCTSAIKQFLTMSTSLTPIRDICTSEDTLEVRAKITRKWYSRHLKTDALMLMDIILLDENIYTSPDIKEIASFIKGEPLTKEVQLIRKENEIFDVKAETMTIEEVKHQRSTAKRNFSNDISTKECIVDSSKKVNIKRQCIDNDLEMKKRPRTKCFIDDSQSSAFSIHHLLQAGKQYGKQYHDIYMNSKFSRLSGLRARSIVFAQRHGELFK